MKGGLIGVLGRGIDADGKPSATLLSRRRRAAIATVAGAVLVVPIAACGGAAVNWVDVANAQHRGQPNRPTPDTLGATGASPHDSQLSGQLQHDAGDPAALLANAGPIADLPSGPLGIPGIVLQAYMRAQQTLAVQEPGCHLPWWLLAGIGKVESNQAEHGQVDTAGNTLRRILGPELNGANGTAAIPAYDGGRWTGDPNWERAVGPMQFLPSTWITWGRGGDPNNVFDAALAAGRYLCAGGRDLSDPAQRAEAVFSYNHSDSYVRLVLIWANAYSRGVQPLPETPVLADAIGPAPIGGPSTVGTPPPVAPPPPGSSAPPPPPPGSSSTPAPTTKPSRPTTTTTSSKPTTTSSKPPTTTTTPTCPTTTTKPSPTTSSAPPTTTTTPPPGCAPPPTTTTTTKPPPVTTTP